MGYVGSGQLKVYWKPFLEEKMVFRYEMSLTECVTSFLKFVTIIFTWFK